MHLPSSRRRFTTILHTLASAAIASAAALCVGAGCDVDDGSWSQCTAAPTCDEGDTEVETCGDGSTCYEAETCGTTILCQDAGEIHLDPVEGG